MWDQMRRWWDDAAVWGNIPFTEVVKVKGIQQFSEYFKSDILLPFHALDSLDPRDCMCPSWLTYHSSHDIVVWLTQHVWIPGVLQKTRRWAAQRPSALRLQSRQYLHFDETKNSSLYADIWIICLYMNRPGLNQMFLSVTCRLCADDVEAEADVEASRRPDRCDGSCSCQMIAIEAVIISLKWPYRSQKSALASWGPLGDTWCWSHLKRVQLICWWPTMNFPGTSRPDWSVGKVSTVSFLFLSDVYTLLLSVFVLCFAGLSL